MPSPYYSIVKSSGISAAIALSLTLAAAVPASALEHSSPEADPEITSSRIALEDISVVSSPSEGIDAVELSLASPERASWNATAEDVNYAKIDDPTAGGGEIEVVWDVGITPTSIDVAYADFGEYGGQTGFGALVEEDSDALEPRAVANENPIAEAEGMYLDHRFCLDFFYEPKYSPDQDVPESNQKHHLTTCYEKFAEEGTDLWAYYRSAMWTNAIPNSETAIAPQIIDFSARTQPWNGDEGFVRRMVDWAPKAPETNCAPGSQVNIGVGGTGITFPTNDCDHTWIDAIPTQGKMGQIFDGTEPRQKTLDYGMLIEANSPSLIPKLADYTWTEVRHRGPQGVTDNDIILWQDLGWVPW